MNDIFLVIKGTPGNLTYSAYYNFKDMCEQEGIDSKKVDKNKLPVQIGSKLQVVKLKIK